MVVEVDSLIQKIAEDGRDEVVRAIDALIERLNRKDAMTRAMIGNHLTEIKKAVEKTTAEFAKQASLRMDEREVETEKRDVREAQTERDNVKEELKEITKNYQTALEILARDAGVTERDIEWASDQADPLAALVHQRKKRSA